MPIKLIMVDFDGVIRQWPTDHGHLEKQYSLLPGSILNTAFSGPLLEPVLRGQTTDSQWRKAIADSLQQAYPKSEAYQAVAAWSESIGKIDAEVLSLLGSYKKLTLALVTNATSRLTDDLAMHGLTNTFDYVFNSSEIGYFKPEPQIYEHVLNHVGLEAADTVFIDDGYAQVAASNELGICGHRYTNIDKLRLFLIDTIGAVD